MVNAEMIPVETGIFNEAYSLMQQAYDMADTEANYDYLLGQCELIAGKYADTHAAGLASDVMLAVAKHIDHVKTIERGTMPQCICQ